MNIFVVINTLYRNNKINIVQCQQLWNIRREYIHACLLFTVKLFEDFDN